MNLSVRKATVADLDLLNEIAIKAKMHWQYPVEWLEAWRDELGLLPEHFETQQVLKLSIDGTIVGHCALEEHATYSEVQHLWILPEYMGKGYGQLLLGLSLHKTTSAGKSVRVTSDPNAANFYQKQGFRKIGEVESLPEGRVLPLMEWAV